MMTNNEGGGKSQDIELNLAPIIDCFTVLVTFLLATTTFMSIGTLDAGIAASGETAVNDSKQPDIQLSLTLQSDQSYKVTISGKSNSNEKISDQEKLISRLTQIKSQYPSVQALTLIADNQVEYKNIVTAMDAVKKLYPAVILGGF